MATETVRDYDCSMDLQAKLFIYNFPTDIHRETKLEKTHAYSPFRFLLRVTATPKGQWHD